MSFYNNYDNCGYDYNANNACGSKGGAGKNFALIVVLFILLIIVGAAYYC